MDKASVTLNYKSLVALYDATPGHLKISYQTKWIDTNYGKTHFVVAGAEDAAPVLVLHGSASNAVAPHAGICAGSVG